MNRNGTEGRSESGCCGVATVRVALPYHLRNLAHVEGDMRSMCPAPVTLRAVLDALEARYPMLRGTIRDYDNRPARARFCASLPAKKIGRWNRPTSRCLKRSLREKSRC